MTPIDAAAKWMGAAFGGKGDTSMKESYIISIERLGLADLPELCRAQSPEMAGELVRALLACHDPNILRVKVEVARTVTQERAV